jgi:sulfonate transport system permease protein
MNRQADYRNEVAVSAHPPSAGIAAQVDSVPTATAGAPAAGRTAADAPGVTSVAGALGRKRLPGWVRLVSPVAVLILWQVLSATGALPPSKLASPVTIGHTAYTLITTNNPSYGTLQTSLLVSAERWGIGFSIGTVIAIVLALITGLSPIGELTLDPIVQVLRSIPLLGILPLFIVWFGIGELPKDLIVLFGALFPMYVNTFAGIRGVDPKLLELSQVLGLSRWERIRHIVLPGSLAQALAGLRLGVVSSLLALVVGEQINANAGLGFMITQAESFLQNNIIIVALVVYAILGLLADWIVRVIERKALAWRPDFNQ